MRTVAFSVGSDVTNISRCICRYYYYIVCDVYRKEDRYEIPARPHFLPSVALKHPVLQLIESHYENNYGGALRRLNAITEKLESLDYATTPPYIVNSLKRRTHCPQLHVAA